MSDAALPPLPTEILTSGPLRVAEEWIDLYGHMNMARYVSLFDEVGYALQERWGVGETYTRETRRGLFVVDVAVSYKRELTAGTPLRLAMRLLKADSKRLVTLMELSRGDDGTLAATMEQLSVHADLTTRRVVPFAPPVAERLHALATVHGALPLPAGHHSRLTGRV
ncbi:thioesterase family protein [Azospirillum sp. YIM B02556]|uniref:Thioesterase family protein n=1 Tax=Azospirillum endophyticum TaxID=2800326 RepID=A0ABS1FBD6_9PROT|nr:thioesterase family protein [Azospirillum endophyticum]MBK1840709.1 thioesterase family protein [Azospirillum endophyticum]